MSTGAYGTVAELRSTHAMGFDEPIAVGSATPRLSSLVTQMPSNKRGAVSEMGMSANYEPLLRIKICFVRFTMGAFSTAPGVAWD